MLWALNEKNSGALFYSTADAERFQNAKFYLKALHKSILEAACASGGLHVRASPPKGSLGHRTHQTQNNPTPQVVLQKLPGLTSLCKEQSKTMGVVGQSSNDLRAQGNPITSEQGLLDL